MDEFISKLKTATATIHKELENTQLSRNIMSPSVTRLAYAEYLSSIYNMHKAIEENVFPIVKIVITDCNLRGKTNQIKIDLSELQMKETLELKPFFDSGFKTSLNFNLGIMYVTEGSTLGGQYILKNIRQVLGNEIPVHFFDVYGKNTGALWKGFLQELNNYQVTLNDARKEEIISGAVYGFERAKHIFNK